MFYYLAIDSWGWDVFQARTMEEVNHALSLCGPNEPHYVTTCRDNARRMRARFIYLRIAY